MKLTVTLPLLLTLLALLALGCGTSNRTARRPMKARHVAAVQPATFESSAGARAMDVQNEMGVYDSADVDETLAEHMEDVRACYDRAGRARKYAAGKVTLRFAVDGAGRPSEVLVIDTELGNYEVERCLVEVARRIKFPPPGGNKGTTFEYGVEFRSTGEMAVQDLDASLKVERDLASFLHQATGPCGVVAPGGASAVFYIEPTGQVGSVGLAADSTLDEQAASCLVHGLRRLKLSAVIPGRALRYRTRLPGAIALRETAGRVVSLRKHRR